MRLPFISGLQRAATSTLGTVHFARTWSCLWITTGLLQALPPTLAPIPNVSVVEDTTPIRVELHVTDPDTPAALLVYQASVVSNRLQLAAPPLVQRESNGPVLLVQPRPNESGNVRIQVRVADPAGGVSTQELDLVVTPTNDSPQIEPLNGSTFTVPAGGATRFSVRVADVDDAVGSLTVTLHPERPDLVAQSSAIGNSFGRQIDLTAGFHVGKTQLHLRVTDPSGASSEAVVTYQVTLPAAVDFGDAPGVYPVTLANDGAWQIANPTFRLGARVDAESDGHPDRAAGVDPDDDGVTWPSILLGGQTNSVQIVASAAGFIDAWIDYDLDGSWNQSEERVFNAVPVISGINRLSFVAPARSAADSTFARVRYSTVGHQNPTGGGGVGEVEDYLVTLSPSTPLLDFGDAPSPFPTRLIQNGARHSPSVLMLGTVRDLEPDHPNAPGSAPDDASGLDDEDGVGLYSPWVPGEAAAVTVVASRAGRLDAWADFSGNQTWGDPGEQIFTNLPVQAGINYLQISVPAAAVGGEIWTRFRLSSTGGLGFDGPAADGEVEDHLVSVVPRVSSCPLPTVSTNRRPNVIVIVSDDLGYSDLGVQGCPDIPTPHIDSIARRGIRFTSGYVTAAVCSPSRAALMTGRYQQRFGHETNPGTSLETSPAFGLPVSESTLGDRFRALNYRTAWIGKSHLGGTAPFHPLERGFQEFFGFIQSHHDYLDPWYPTNQIDPILRGTEVVHETNYLTRAFERECVDFINRHAQEPFFLYAAFNAVHFPLQATSDLSNRVVSLPIASAQRRAMAAVLLGLDDAIGSILHQLQILGLETNTLVVFTTDNGGQVQLGSLNTPLRGGKTEVYEGGIRVPFFLQWPGHLPTNQLYHAPVSTLDILPTVLAAAGRPPSPAWHLDGVNLLPYICGLSNEPPHPSLFWRIETDGKDQAEEVHDGIRAVRQGDWKLIKPGAQSTWELYNLAVDIGETNDLANARPEVVQQMVVAYQEWSAQMARPRWAVDDLHFEAPDFFLETVRTGEAGGAFQSPDILANNLQVTYQSELQELWRGALDPATGFFLSGHGRDQRVDTGLVRLGTEWQGPAWGLSSNGAAIYYSKPDATGHAQLWRAGPDPGLTALTALTSDPLRHSLAGAASQDPAASATQLVFDVGALPGTVRSWTVETPMGIQPPTALPNPTLEPGNGHWIPGSADLAYATISPSAPTNSQIARLNTLGGQVQIISDNSGEKTDVWAFEAPEFNGELCYVSVIDRQRIGVYRNLGDRPDGVFTRVVDVPLPAEGQTRYLHSLRPLFGRRGFNGVSYFSVVADSSPDPHQPIAPAMWLVGLGPDNLHPLARRVDPVADTGSTPTRRDPRAVAGSSEVLYYYTQLVGTNPAQLHLARTGVRHPDHRGATNGYAQLRYDQFFRSGGTDSQQQYLGGTETLKLVGHQGRLYAAQGSTGNQPYPTNLLNLRADWAGAQILVKDSPVAPWRTDEATPPIFRKHLRTETLEEVTLTTDADGNSLPAPVTLLLAGLSDIGPIGSTRATTRTRRDRPPVTWEDSHVATTADPANVISLGAHLDRATGATPVHHVFAGLSNGEIYRGVYDANESGSIRWSANHPESTTGGPVTGFAEVNGILYASIGLRSTNPPTGVTGGIYYRQDRSESWQLAYRWPHPADLVGAREEDRLMRSLTAVPEPHGGGRQVLLGTRAWPGLIERLDPNPDPARGHEITVELDVRDFLARHWRDDRLYSAPVELGYSGFTTVTNPVTDEVVELLGLWLQAPDGTPVERQGSYFLIRHRDATYELAPVTAAGLGANDSLRATRTLAPSPFPGDPPGAIYLGGYDAGTGTAHETAWIQRGSWSSWPDIQLTPGPDDSWLLEWPNLPGSWILEARDSLDVHQPWGMTPERPGRGVDHQSLELSSPADHAFFRLRRR